MRTFRTPRTEEKRPFEWDHFSDQPKVILDKRYKYCMRLKNWPDLIKVAASASAILPISLVFMIMEEIKRTISNGKIQASDPERFFGMGVNLEKGTEQFEMIAELGIKEVLVRLPLWDLGNIQNYVKFVETWRDQGCKVMLNVLQDVGTIGNRVAIREQAQIVFGAFGEIVGKAQIGNAINRSKWGFYGVNEYLDFFEIFKSERDLTAPNIELCGPSVIDFEYHVALRALFNLRKIQYDQVSALLYVDRCGHPDKKQYGLFNLRRKIELFSAMSRMSPKVKTPKILITEVNWPLLGREPYAPTSVKECVTTECYAKYMADYHEIAYKTGMVETVYWHQLIAPGYGLIDNRKNSLPNKELFNRYRTMIASYKGH